MTHADEVKNALRLALKATGRTQRSVSLGLGKYLQWLSNHLADVKNHSNGFINRVLGEVGIRRSDFEAYLEGRLGSDPRLHLAEMMESGSGPDLHKIRPRATRVSKANWEELDGLWRSTTRLGFLRAAAWQLKSGCENGKTEAWSLLGASARREGKKKQAAYCYLQALNRNGDREAFGRSLVRMSYLFETEAELELSEECGRLGVGLLASCNDWLAKGLAVVGRTAFLVGRYEESAACSLWAFSNSKSHFDKFCAAQGHGLSLAKIGNYSEAFIWGQRAKSLGHCSTLDLELLFALSKEGQRDFTAALKHYEAAERLSNQADTEILNLLELRVQKLRFLRRIGAPDGAIRRELDRFRSESQEVSPKFLRFRWNLETQSGLPEERQEHR